MKWFYKFYLELFTSKGLDFNKITTSKINFFEREIDFRDDNFCVATCKDFCETSITHMLGYISIGGLRSLPTPPGYIVIWLGLFLRLTNQ